MSTDDGESNNIGELKIMEDYIPSQNIGILDNDPTSHLVTSISQIGGFKLFEDFETTKNENFLRELEDEIIKIVNEHERRRYLQNLLSVETDFRQIEIRISAVKTSCVTIVHKFTPLIENILDLIREYLESLDTVLDDFDNWIMNNESKFLDVKHKEINKRNSLNVDERISYKTLFFLLQICHRWNISNESWLLISATMDHIRRVHNDMIVLNEKLSLLFKPFKNITSKLRMMNCISIALVNTLLALGFWSCSILLIPTSVISASYIMKTLKEDIISKTNVSNIKEWIKRRSGELYDKDIKIIGVQKELERLEKELNGLDRQIILMKSEREVRRRDSLIFVARKVKDYHLSCKNLLSSLHKIEEASEVKAINNNYLNSDDENSEKSISKNDEFNEIENKNQM